MLFLCSIYGLRSLEVVKLRSDDFDFKPHLTTKPK